MLWQVDNDAFGMYIASFEEISGMLTEILLVAA